MPYFQPPGSPYQRIPPKGLQSIADRKVMAPRRRAVYSWPAAARRSSHGSPALQLERVSARQSRLLPRPALPGVLQRRQDLVPQSGAGIDGAHLDGADRPHHQQAGAARPAREGVRVREGALCHPHGRGARQGAGREQPRHRRGAIRRRRQGRSALLRQPLLVGAGRQDGERDLSRHRGSDEAREQIRNRPNSCCRPANARCC